MSFNYGSLVWETIHTSPFSWLLRIIEWSLSFCQEGSYIDFYLSVYDDILVTSLIPQARKDTISQLSDFFPLRIRDPFISLELKLKDLLLALSFIRLSTYLTYLRRLAWMVLTLVSFLSVHQNWIMILLFFKIQRNINL